MLNIKDILFPKETILNLSIHRDSLRFVLSRGKRIIYQSIFELKESVIEKGEIKKKEIFFEILKKLAQIARKKGGIKKGKNIPVFISIPDNQIYYQRIEIPTLEKKELREAISLNLVMNSPFEKGKFYCDWQIVKENKINQTLCIFAAFAKKSYINLIGNIFEEAGFKVEGIETHSISLNRLLRESLKDYQSYNWLNFYLNREGIDVFFSVGGKIISGFFVEWLERIDKIDLKKATGFLEKNIYQISDRIVSYYQEFFQEKRGISSIFLEGDNILLGNIKKIAHSLEEKVKIPIRILFANSPLNVCYGLYLRKSFTKKYSQDINLIGSDILKRNLLEEEKRIVNYWVKNCFILMVILIFLFLASLLFMKRIEEFFRSYLTNTSKESQNIRIFRNLKQEANDFNFQVDMVLKINKATIYPSEFLDDIYKVSKKNYIQIDKIYFNDLETPVRLIGKTKEMTHIINFKNELKDKKDLYKEVSLSMDSLRKIDNDLVFEITFQLAK